MIDNLQNRGTGQGEPTPSERSKRHRRKNTAVKFLKDSLLFGITPFFEKASGLLLIPIIGKLMGATEYGIWQQYQITLTLLVSFGTINAAAAMNRFLAGEDDREAIGRELFGTLLFVLALSGAIGSVVMLMREPGSRFIFGDAGQLSIYVLLLGVNIPLMGVHNQYAAFVRARRWARAATLFATLGRSIRLVGLILVAFLSREIGAMILFLVAIDLAGVLVYALYTHGVRGIPAVQPSFRHIRGYLHFGLPLLLLNIGYWSSMVADRYLITHFIGLAAVGVYTAAYVLAATMTIVLKPFLSVLLPDLSVLYDSGEIGTVEERFRVVQKYVVAITAGATIGLIILAEPLLLVIGDESFVRGTAAMRFIAPGIFLYGILKLHSRLLNVIKAWYVGPLWLAVGIANLGLNLILIPRYGLVGAALATLVAFAAGVIAAVLATSRTFSIGFELPALVRIIVAGAVMAGAVLGLGPLLAEHPVGYIFASVVAGAAVYLGVLWATGFPTSKERMLLDRFIKRKRAPAADG